MNPSVATRRLYKMEETSGPLLPDHLLRPRPIADLRKRGEGIWSVEAPPGSPCPEITAGRGVLSGRWVSYQVPGRIVLARSQRTLHVLIHEMAHALTPYTKLDHGPAFCRMFFFLLWLYGGANPLLLGAYARYMKVRLK